LATPVPITSAGRSAPSSIALSRSIPVALGGAHSVSSGSPGHSHSRSQSSTGIDTNTGPIGGVSAVAKARIRASGTSSARAGSIAHLTNGRGNSVGRSA
jgi:hypothetical protein